MLLEVKDVTKHFSVREGLFAGRRQKVLKGVSFKLNHGECLGILGESGSGKSTLGKIVLGLEEPSGGRIKFSAEVIANPLFKSVVFQDYTTSVNPRLRIAEIIAEPLRRLPLSKIERSGRVAALLDEVGLSGDLLSAYPHQLSGGQLQRVCIARAIAPNPVFILLDEAVSSLDVSVQAQVLDLLCDLKAKHEIAFLFITHDITVATYICDRLLFFKDGRVTTQLDDLAGLCRVTDDYARELLQAAHYLEQPFAASAPHVRTA